MFLCDFVCVFEYLLVELVMMRLLSKKFFMLLICNISVVFRFFVFKVYLII